MIRVAPTGREDRRNGNRGLDLQSTIGRQPCAATAGYASRAAARSFEHSALGRPLRPGCLPWGLPPKRAPLGRREHRTCSVGRGTVSDRPAWLIGVQLLDGVGAGLTGALFPV